MLRVKQEAIEAKKLTDKKAAEQNEILQLVKTIAAKDNKLEESLVRMFESYDKTLTAIVEQLKQLQSPQIRVKGDQSGVMQSIALMETAVTDAIGNMKKELLIVLNLLPKELKVNIPPATVQKTEEKKEWKFDIIRGNDGKIQSVNAKQI